MECISRKRGITEGGTKELYRFVRSLSYSMVNQIVIIVELQKKDEFRSGGNYEHNGILFQAPWDKYAFRSNISGEIS